MRILFLTQWFQPEPSFKGLPFAKALAAGGHEVEVLTGFPNYPGGKVYPGYRVRFYQRETMDGITVHRVPLYPSHDKSALHRILNYSSFALMVLLIGPWKIKKPHVVYVYNLITLGPAAFLFRYFFNAKVIIDVQDLWPESVTNSKMLRNRTALNLLNRVCNWAYRGADRLAVLSPGFKKELVNRGIKPEKIDVIYNWCDEASLAALKSTSETKKLFDLAGKFVVLFAGTMGPGQGLETVLNCASLCKDVLPDVCFILIGSGIATPHIKELADEIGLNNVTFLPPRAPDMMGEVFAMSSALLVHLRDEQLYRITIPSKTQAYLFIGKPIIMAMRGDAAALIRETGAGVVCHPDDPNDMMKAIKSLYELSEIERQKMGESGHSYYVERLSLNEGVKRFECMMMELV